MFNKEEVIEKCKKDIRSNLKTRKRWLAEAKAAWKNLDYLNLLPEFGEMPIEFREMEENKLVLQCPYNKVLREDMKSLMISAGWKVRWELKEEDCSHTWEFPNVMFNHPNIDSDFVVIIVFNERVEGSTCQRRQIGTQKKNVPVYEWACEDMVMTGSTEYNG